MAQFRVFGPVELLAAGVPLDLGPPKQRAVLAALVLDAGNPVSLETLIERLWAGDPPRQPRNALYGHVARLRKLLQQAAASEGVERPARLVRRAGGYVLDVEPDCVDVHRFERLVSEAGDPAADVGQQAVLLRAALELWHGPPLADLSGPWVERTRLWLTQVYLDAFLAWGRVELRLGNPDQVVAHALQLLAEHPLVEPLAALLIHALHEAGRTAEALDRYELTRRRLVDDLGVDPGAELRELHLALLRGEAISLAQPGHPGQPGEVAPPSQPSGPAQRGQLADAAQPGDAAQSSDAAQPGDRAHVGRAAQSSRAVQPSGPAQPGQPADAAQPGQPGDRAQVGRAAQSSHAVQPSGPAQPGQPADAVQPARPAPTAGEQPASPPPDLRPAQLPPELVSLTGRELELGELVTFARRGNRGAGMAAVCAIDGMPGVGKTALAVHAAHRLARHYPDGQLFLDLRGFTASIAPLSPGEALERLLKAVGVAAALIPQDVDERAALWRSRMAGRRYLLLLDNAVDASQVRPLLTAAPESLTLVTSRQRLSTLDAAQHVALDVLELPDAIALFRTLVEAERRTRDPDALVTQAVQLCGRLPLAVRLLAGRLRHRPGWTLTDLVTRLRDRRRRLAELGSGPEGVAAAFRLSYEQLGVPRQRLYRLLSLQPGTDLDTYAAAALAGIQVEQAEPALEALVDAHLLESSSLGRYFFHDLLRAHADELVRLEEPKSERDAAVRRLLDYYLNAAAQAMDAYAPAERHRRPPVRSPGLPIPPFTASGERAEAWLAEERANLVALADYAAERESIGALATCLFGYLNDKALYSDALALHNKHLAAARTSADVAGQARALYHLGETYYRLNRHDVALDCLDQADRLLSAAGGQDERAYVLHVRGCVLEDVGRFPDALACLTNAARLHHASGDLGGEARTLCALSELDRIFGRFTQAEAHALQALELARTAGDRLSEGAAHRFLGAVYVGMSRYQEALRHSLESLRRYRGIGNRPRECLALVSAGNALRGLGRLDDAVGRYREALAIAAEIRNPNSEFEARYALGEALREGGELTEALDHLRKALGLARELGQEYDQAQTEHALGRAYLDLGDPAAAREHVREGSAIYERLGVPAARSRSSVPQARASSGGGPG